MIGTFWCGRIMRFFFSSRRRHTRCLSDWSSDVCSSDLHAAVALGARRRLRQVALAVLVVVEVLLPEVAELEDPVLALRRPELDDEGLRGGLAPGAEGEVAVRDAAVAQVGRPREAQLVGARREVLLPPGAHELGVGEHDLARLR